jgi:glycosyltransferase involved in cell wall biosynthesis
MSNRTRGLKSCAYRNRIFLFVYYTLFDKHHLQDFTPQPTSLPCENTVLVIAYYFPPMGLSGVQRTLKFVKYLPQSGWKPIVLTTPIDTPYYAFDNTLLEELDEEINSGKVIIYRTEADPSLKHAKKNGKILKLPRRDWQLLRSKIMQIFRQPDSRIFWKDIAIKKAEVIFANHKIDAIFSTAPPYTDFLIARDLKQKFDVPYLMDYRDTWVGNPVMNFYLTPFHRRKAHRMEYEALRASDAITVANRKMKETLLGNYLFLDWNDVTILSQGYDPGDIRNAAPLAENMMKPDVFKVTYTGVFYILGTPKSFLRAAKEAIAEVPELAGCLELHFVGVLQKEYQKLIKKLNLEGNVVEHGYLPHPETVAQLMASDVLWMTMSDDFSAPGKMYEYFGTRKPVIGLVPKGSHAERMLSDYGNATVAEPDDVGAIKRALLEYFALWKAWKLPVANNEEFIRKFDRQILAKELALQLTFMSGSLDGEIKKLRRK